MIIPDVKRIEDIARLQDFTVFLYTEAGRSHYLCLKIPVVFTFDGAWCLAARETFIGAVIQAAEKLNLPELNALTGGSIIFRQAPATNPSLFAMCVLLSHDNVCEKKMQIAEQVAQEFKEGYVNTLCSASAMVTVTVTAAFVEAGAHRRFLSADELGPPITKNIPLSMGGMDLLNLHAIPPEKLRETIQQALNRT